MLRSQARSTRRHWETLSDDQLLETELMTDDPESLPNLVFEIPPGDEEPYVEFKYDLRKSDRGCSPASTGTTSILPAS
jgi:hypothetical protein